MSKKITYSAPVPISFAGREGIIYGKPALFISLSNRISVSISEKNNTLFEKEIEEINKAVSRFLNTKTEAITCSLDILSFEKSEVISSVLVATTACIYEYYSGKTPSVDDVVKLAFTAEKKLNASALGIEISCSAIGGIVYFRKEFAFLKGVYSLPFKIPSVIQEHLYISSVSNKNKFEDLYKKNPKKAENYFNTLEKIVKRYVISFVKEDQHFFAETATQYQNVYRTVVDDFLESDNYLVSVLNDKKVILFSEKKSKKLIPLRFSFEGFKKEI